MFHEFPKNSDFGNHYGFHLYTIFMDIDILLREKREILSRISFIDELLDKYKNKVPNDSEVLEFIRSNKFPVRAADIAKNFGVDTVVISLRLAKLKNKKMVTCQEYGSYKKIYTSN